MESTQYMNNKLSDELRQFRCHILDIRPIQEDEKPTFSYMTGMRREEDEEEGVREREREKEKREGMGHSDAENESYDR